MSRKGTYSKKKFLFDYPELIQKLRRSRTNYDFPVIKISDILGKWVVLETFVDDVKTKNGNPTLLLIISFLQDPGNPESDRGWEKYKVFCGSKKIIDFLMDLRKSEMELEVLPLVLRFISTPFFDKKTGEQKIRYEIDCGLDIPPAQTPEN